MALAITLYLASLVLQLFATGYAVNLFFRAKIYRFTCGCLLLALGLMLGRRIWPIFHALNDGHINLADAILSVPISLFLMLGMFQLRKVLINLEGENTRLDFYSKVDPLTKALNRIETFSRAEMEIERSLRSGHEVSFLMLDIDHFKNVNDKYGHLCGDAVLVDLVGSCKEELRVIDVFGRVGGEEFFIALPESDSQEAYRIAERLRTRVSKKIVSVDRNTGISITISIGVATFNPKCVGQNTPNVILQKFFKMADDAMYKAKGHGRNRCEIYS